MKKTTLLLCLATACTAALAEDTTPPKRRADLYSSSIAGEVFRRQILGKQQPAAPLVPNASGRAYTLNAYKTKGPLKTIEYGMHKINKDYVVFQSVDWRDRGYAKEANEYLSQFEGKEVEALCVVQLPNGPKVCQVWGMLNGKEVNIGAEMMRQGWFGWQAETGGNSGGATSEAAKEAYYASRGVWSNPGYFPSASSRNAYAQIILK